MKRRTNYWLVLVLGIVQILNIDSVYAQSWNSENTSSALSEIDSNTLKLRNRLYASLPAGDLNIYGFEEEDVPVYADSVYAMRLSILETEIPLAYNKYVRGYIDLYTLRRRALVSKMLKLSQYYFPVIEEIFDREGVPLELKYLAIIESALNQNAVSPVGAAGMWQFMAPTARIFGLKSTYAYDERREFIQSTEAAVRYFKNSYKIYNDWLLVIASYNCGPGNVNKAIRHSGGKHDFWSIMPYLPRETRGYVPAFIAAAYTMNYASEHNIYPSENDLTIHLDTVMVDNRYSIDQLAFGLNMSVDEIRQLNPGLRRGSLPFTSDKIALTLPYQKAIRFYSMNDTAVTNQMMAMYNERPHNMVKRQDDLIIYKVHKGEMLAELASRFNVKVRDLKRWNRIKGNKIHKGQKLKIRPDYRA